MLKRVTLNLLRTAIFKTKCYNLKLFYFSIYCLLLVGCGKKIEQPTTEEVRRPRLESSIVILKAKLFKTGNAVDEEYTFDDDAEVRIPEEIEVTQGNAGNQLAKIYFNVNPDGSYGFHCEYFGGASSQTPQSPEDITEGHSYQFDTCYKEVNGNFEVINYYPGYESIQYENKSVVLSIVGADPRFDTQASAEFEIINH